MSFRAGITCMMSMVILVGCTTVSPTNSKSSSKAEEASALRQGTGLPPQTLAEGNCGVFLWDDARPQKFVFFHDLDSNTVKYYFQDGIIALQVDPLKPPNLDEQGMIARYQADGFKEIRLSVQFSGEMDGGQRISNSAITLEKPDGWVEIRPTTGLYFCQSVVP